LKFSESKKAFLNAFHVAAAAASTQPASKAKQIQLNTNTMLQSHRPESRKVMERPLPLAEIRGGKRRVPYFLAVQGVPFLRYSKPQSPTLGRVLRQKITWEVKKWDQRKRLNNVLIPLGEHEDAWDALVALQEKQEGVTTEKTAAGRNGSATNSKLMSWASPTRAAEEGIAQDIRDFDRRNLELSRRMVEILKQERILAAEERLIRKSGKKNNRSRDRQTTVSPGKTVNES
jgi:hypothetical protein